MKIAVCLLLAVSSAAAWSSAPQQHHNSASSCSSTTSLEAISRRSAIASSAALLGAVVPVVANADDEEVATVQESIAERAAKIAKAVEQEEETSGETTNMARPAGYKNADTRTAFDFDVPVAGELVNFKDLVQQNDEMSKVKAILVVNIKQDDPIARKNIPEFITMAAKYGRDGEFVVVLTPTDQGYYEPDTSALIRLKLASEYGYGINPATTLTDKMNLLGTGCHPFWRWLEGTCRTPVGLGRIQGNFEKFLLDGTTGLPLRRYPRKYMPNNIKDDIEALLAGKPLPPAGSNFLEEWRVSDNDSERDTYRFQKGLNVFDQ